MIIYDLIAGTLICISHVFLYFYLIRYRLLSLPMIVLLSIIFSILLGFVVSVTGYPEFNFILLCIFLFSLGLMKENLSFKHNLYFTLASIVSLSLLKIILMELGMVLFMWSPINLYIWTTSIINFIVSIFIIVTVISLGHFIQRFAEFIVLSQIYYLSFVVLIIGS